MKMTLLTICTLLLFASCKDNQNTIAVAGDSWSLFTCTYHSLDNSLAAVGITNTSTSSVCEATTHIGETSDNWLTSNYHKATLLNLADTTVKVLYLSLGGNDLINNWTKTMTPTQEQDMITAIKTRMTAIIATYQQARPDIKILISGYDFPRFTADNQIQAYREAYLNMGSPTPLELNSALIRYSQAMAGLADQKSVFYIQHLGLMHYFYGDTADGLAPLTTAAPDLISPINNPTQTGGSPSHLTDPTAMLNAGGQVDAFHLSSTGFGKLADHSVSIYLKTWLQ